MNLLLPTAFLGLASLGAYRTLQAPASDDGLVAFLAESRSLSSLSIGNPPREPGTFPAMWDAGVDCGSEVPVQVHAYNANLFILRQSKCEIFEAPFMYLIFGDDEVLLMDTGALPSTPIYATVNRIITKWLADNARTSIDFTVAHTHGHFDHVQGDAQFSGAPGVTQFIPANLSSQIQFFGFQNYPFDIPQIDLGNRVIDVIGTPGHHPSSVTLYDHRTQLMLSGDIVYPGHLFIFQPSDLPVFTNSLRRMITFAMRNPVENVVGCHIEFSNTPGVPYAYGTAVHPDERPLEFEPDKLIDIYRAAQQMSANPLCTIFDDFVIHLVYQCGITWNG